MKIGFDVDEVLFTNSMQFDKYAALHFGSVPKPLSKQTSYSLEDNLDITTEQVDEMLLAVLPTAHTRPVQGAKRTLWELFNIGKIESPVHLITARRPSFHLMTQRQCQTILPSHVFKLHHTFDKARLINYWELDWFVDDCLEHCMDIACNTKAQVLVFDKPWNQSHLTERCFPKIRRVGNWRANDQWAHIKRRLAYV
jgi:uncharacterized HAD superfamily protein